MTGNSQTRRPGSICSIQLHPEWLCPRYVCLSTPGSISSVKSRRHGQCLLLWRCGCLTRTVVSSVNKSCLKPNIQNYGYSRTSMSHLRRSEDDDKGWAKTIVHCWVLFGLNLHRSLGEIWGTRSQVPRNTCTSFRALGWRWPGIQTCACLETDVCTVSISLQGNSGFKIVSVPRCLSRTIARESEGQPKVQICLCRIARSQDCVWLHNLWGTGLT